MFTLFYGTEDYYYEDSFLLNNVRERLTVFRNPAKHGFRLENKQNFTKAQYILVHTLPELT